MTTFVPLIVIPVVSRLTSDTTGDGENGERFYAMLAGEPLERESA